MDSINTSLLDLPNELILHTLSCLTTEELLPFATISQRIHALICRVIHARLYECTTLVGRTILLECYHPSQKLTEPPLFCSYLSTPGLDSCLLVNDGEDEKECHAIGRLDTLRNLYSAFQPYRRVVSKRAHPAGDIPGSRTYTSPSSSSNAAPSNAATSSASGEREPVKHILSLEGHELFTQLCCVTNLVRTGPRQGIFRSFITIEEGFIRVWKDWLSRMSQEACNIPEKATEEQQATSGGNELEPSGGLVDAGKDWRVLWVDPKKNIGLRVKVTEKKWRRQMPVLIHADEEVSVSFEIEYHGMAFVQLVCAKVLTPLIELVVRSAHLLLMLEKSNSQDDNQSGKAVVFGTFGST
jgi:hypothetical protein